MIIFPEVNTPENVKLCFTTRSEGFSSAEFSEFNLADHVGDDSDVVNLNRQLLEQKIGLPISWLEQVHSDTVVRQSTHREEFAKADAVFTQELDTPCAVLTADCLPVFIWDSLGEQVAVAHAGWRGLAAGIIQKTVRSFSFGLSLSAFLGPAIGPKYFEVGEDVRQAFLEAQQIGLFSQQSESCVTHAFVSLGKEPASGREKYLADIYMLARMALASVGVTVVEGGSYCTYSDAQQFYSFRRDGQCGRMASLIWLAS